ncbi:hypothetical protein D3C84_559870 [compost metagenome]
MPAELIAAGIAALAFAIGLAMGELALVLAAVFEFQAPEAGILIGLEFAAIGHAVFLERALALASTQFETAGVAAVMGGQHALAMEQALVETTAVDLAVAAVPFALAMPLALVELAGIPAAVRVVDATLALQQAIDQIAPIPTTIGQPCVRRQQRFAVATCGEQQGQCKRCK